MPAAHIITFGEIMARLAVPGWRRFQQAIPGPLESTFAGAEVNVAVAVAQLGGHASFVSALPQHELADAAVANLRAMSVGVQHVARTPRGRMGLFFLEHGMNQRPASVIYDREGSAFSIASPDLWDWTAIFDGAYWLHLSGITPAISENTAALARHAVQAASQRGVRVSFDMNYRSRLWSWEPGTPPRELAKRVVCGLLPYVQVFFGGPDDIALLTGAPFTASENHAAAKRLAAQFPNLQCVAALLREQHCGAALRLSGALCDAVAGESCLAPQVAGHFDPYCLKQEADRLGGGDAFAAGLIFALTTPELAAPLTAVSFATALACLAHTIEGDFCAVRRCEVEGLMHGNTAGRVNR